MNASTAPAGAAGGPAAGGRTAETRPPRDYPREAAMVPVDRLQFNRHNIRRDLGDLSALTASIRAEGVLQNILQGREPRAMTRRRRASRQAPRRSGPPRIRPTRVHELCHQWETGRIDGASVVTELRAALGGWTPAVPRDQEAPSENTDAAEAHHDESAQTR